MQNEMSTPETAPPTTGHREETLPRINPNKIKEYQGSIDIKHKKSQITKNRENKRNSTRRNTEQRQEMEGSRIGTDDMSMYDQTEVSQEKSEGLLRRTMINANIG